MTLFVKPVLSTCPALIEPSSQSATLVSTLLIPAAMPPYQWPASSASTGVEHRRQAASTGHRVCELLCIGFTSLVVGRPMRSPRAAAETLEKRDDVGDLVVLQRGVELHARHHAHGLVQRGDAAVVEIRRGQRDIA